jgi:hypothetical protein
VPTLCDATHCNALDRDHPLFFDADHVSPYGNMMLLASFQSAIDGLGAPLDGKRLSVYTQDHLPSQAITWHINTPFSTAFAVLCA